MAAEGFHLQSQEDIPGLLCHRSSAICLGCEQMYLNSLFFTAQTVRLLSIKKASSLHLAAAGCCLWLLCHRVMANCVRATQQWSGVQRRPLNSSQQIIHTANIYFVQTLCALYAPPCLRASKYLSERPFKISFCKVKSKKKISESSTKCSTG